MIISDYYNPLDCSSFRPISLIPCDLKIYAKVFASRMEKVIHSLIKEDQTGFIKGRNASDNMRRLFHILDFADSHSHYKINWSKSALMPINNVKVNFSIPSFIPIKESFTYLGITIYKNIHKIARDNFNNILVKVKNDIQRWKNLKVSLQGRISTVKMNLLPRFNFFSLYTTTFSPSRLL